MLKGIHPLLHADLLHALAAMGHGDELAIVDANFPAATVSRRVLHVVGASASETLDAILTLFPLDTSVTPAAFTMEVTDDPEALPEPVREFGAYAMEKCVVVHLHKATQDVVVSGGAPCNTAPRRRALPRSTR